MMPVWASRLLAGGALLVLCMISGVVGAALNGHFGTSAYTISFADFVSIMLMGCTLIVTVLAVVLAVFGFIGWITIRDRVHEKTNEYLNEAFKEGKPLYMMLQKRATHAMYQGVAPVNTQTEDDEDQAEGQA